MKIYKCLCEAIDYWEKPNAMQELREILESFDTLRLLKTFMKKAPLKKVQGQVLLWKFQK